MGSRALSTSLCVKHICSRKDEMWQLLHELILNPEPLCRKTLSHHQPVTTYVWTMVHPAGQHSAACLKLVKYKIHSEWWNNSKLKPSVSWTWLPTLLKLHIRVAVWDTLPRDADSCVFFSKCWLGLQNTFLKFRITCCIYSELIISWTWSLEHYAYGIFVRNLASLLCLRCTTNLQF